MTTEWVVGVRKDIFLTSKHLSAAVSRAYSSRESLFAGEDVAANRLSIRRAPLPVPDACKMTRVDGHEDSDGIHTVSSVESQPPAQKARIDDHADIYDTHIDFSTGLRPPLHTTTSETSNSHNSPILPIPTAHEPGTHHGTTRHSSTSRSVLELLGFWTAELVWASFAVFGWSWSC